MATEGREELLVCHGRISSTPLSLLVLAAYLEREPKDAEIEVLDCQAESVGWEGLEKRIISFAPHIVVPINNLQAKK